MKILKFAEGEWDQWEHMRRGKITGSKARGLYGKRDADKKLIGFWELVAERLGMPPESNENAMERGSRLEGEALDRFEKETGKKLDREKTIWMRDDNESIAISPDAAIGELEAVEAKCLSSARHIEAYCTRKIPSDYEAQKLQYFVVNDKLETLHFVFYDPRFAIFVAAQAEGTAPRIAATPDGKTLDYFEIIVKRADVQADVEEATTRQRKVLAEVNEIVNKLTF